MAVQQPQEREREREIKTHALVSVRVPDVAGGGYLGVAVNTHDPASLYRHHGMNQEEKKRGKKEEGKGVELCPQTLQHRRRQALPLTPSLCFVFVFRLCQRYDMLARLRNSNSVARIGDIGVDGLDCIHAENVTRGQPYGYSHAPARKTRERKVVYLKAALSTFCYKTEQHAVEVPLR